MKSLLQKPRKWSKLNKSIIGWISFQPNGRQNNKFFIFFWSKNFLKNVFKTKKILVKTLSTYENYTLNNCTWVFSKPKWCKRTDKCAFWHKLILIRTKFRITLATFFAISQFSSWQQNLICPFWTNASCTSLPCSIKIVYQLRCFSDKKGLTIG